ncbi:hypothetical protein [Paenibacillus alvei]|uniref:Uncharacterized protein n=1 Tax=Paenibacillus alvei TaxID=44250 RepID=A0A383R6E0_PAEAL|nr:hypothetical protein [Paenibacillus alvei]SYX81896.1 protein of unknown function [Paenibacillus alvei]
MKAAVYPINIGYDIVGHGMIDADRWIKSRQMIVRKEWNINGRTSLERTA